MYFHLKKLKGKKEPNKYFYKFISGVNNQVHNMALKQLCDFDVNKLGCLFDWYLFFGT